VVSDFNAYAPVNQILSITNQFTVLVTAVAPRMRSRNRPLPSQNERPVERHGPRQWPAHHGLVRWGTSASYGNQTPPVNVGGSYDVVYVTSQINNLVMYQPYHFRLGGEQCHGCGLWLRPDI